MTILTREEYRTLQAIATNKPRDLNAVELLLLAIKNGTYDKEVIRNEVKRYVDNTYHADKILEVLDHRNKLPELLKSYPMVEFHDAIFKRQYNKYIGMEMEHGSSLIKNRVTILNEMIGVINQLPLGIDTFISTYETNYYDMREKYSVTKDRKFLGYVLPQALQKLLNTYTSMPKTHDMSEEWGFIEDPELLRRVGIVRPEREDGYQTLVNYERIKIADDRVSLVLVVRVMDQDVQKARYWFVV